MTVAAIILAASPESALRDVEGLANVRRLVDVAWAGGAVPVVVCAPDPDGAVTGELAGTNATYARPAPTEAGPAGQILNGIAAALNVVSETDAALVWPARMGWVDAETVTSLIEAHGLRPGALLRPTFRATPGWPVLVPVAHVDGLRTMDAGLMPDDIVAELVGRVANETVELGDPGVVFDLDTPRAELPPFEAPPPPPAGHQHEWGAAIADRSDDAPLEGPGLAPYGQAVAEVPDQPG
ncbi:MAG TPA: NTP transferase domain-containing protein [Candidatus Limnocylindrales bacterium]|nr:NTP transferase domain-containing protein [Candidatus Limnocylindrales bacterium]